MLPPPTDEFGRFVPSPPRAPRRTAGTGSSSGTTCATGCPCGRLPIPGSHSPRWDGLFPIDLPASEALTELKEEPSDLRTEAGRDEPFDLVVDPPAGSPIDRWEEAGATWILADFGLQPREREVRETIEAGPR